MKIKLNLVAAALLTAGGANAQSFSEDFNVPETVIGLALNGWSFTGLPAITYTNLSNPTDGDLFLIGETTATFNFQVVNTTPFYLVSFYASRPTTVDNPLLDVTFNAPGTAIDEVKTFSLTSAGVGADPDGLLYSWHFGSPVTPGSYSLTFSNSGAFSAVSIDSLSITAVPEPSTYALMLAGLGVVGFAARRRKLGFDGAASQRFMA